MTSDEAVERHRNEIYPPERMLDRIIDGAVGRTLGRVEARTIFGEPESKGDCTVIPVGRVSTRYGFGGGSGRGPSDDDGDAGGGGGGGGGGILQVKPVGYIEIAGNGSRFVPITDSSAIAIRAVTMGSIVAALFVIGLFRAIRSRES